MITSMVIVSSSNETLIPLLTVLMPISSASSANAYGAAARIGDPVGCRAHHPRVACAEHQRVPPKAHLFPQFVNRFSVNRIQLAAGDLRRRQVL